MTGYAADERDFISYTADERGTVTGLLAGPGLITEVFTVKGQSRTGHVHDASHWTYVVSGKLLAVTRERGSRGWRPPLCTEYGPRDLICMAAGTAHAWQALEDTVALVFSAMEIETEPVQIPLW